MNVCIVKITIQHKVLLVKHVTRGWEFPGGKVDYEKDKFYDHSCMVDLLAAATREFEEEVSSDTKTVFKGKPSNILFEPNFNTVFFIYDEQSCDTPTTHTRSITHHPHTHPHTHSQDEAISECRYFTLEQLQDLNFSFESDKELLKILL